MTLSNGLDIRGDYSFKQSKKVYKTTARSNVVHLLDCNKFTRVHICGVSKTKIFFRNQSIINQSTFVSAGVWSLDGSRNVVLENEVELAEWVEGSVSQGNGDVTSKAPSANGKETVIEEEDVGRDLDKLYSSVSCENRFGHSLDLGLYSAFYLAQLSPGFFFDRF